MDGSAIAESAEAAALAESYPKAPRPTWLPAAGPGQAHVDPVNWSISIGQWLRFVRACVDTATWRQLAKAKGEYGVTMHDLCTHFVKPWTAGTGCSVALLMNGNQEPSPVEAFLSPLNLVEYRDLLKGQGYDDTSDYGNMTVSGNVPGATARGPRTHPAAGRPGVGPGSGLAPHSGFAWPR